MTDIIIFAGTTEGRKLGSFLASQGVRVTMCVATDYAGQLIEKNNNLEVFNQRLNAEEIEKLIKEKSCSLVVDATHPYATEVTKNISLAVKKTGAEYLRLVREKSETKERYMYVSSVKEAAQYLEKNPMKTLLTIGSKELTHFTNIPGFAENVFARVLPFAEVVENCTQMGFKGKQLICMQGPFSTELNVAMVNSLQIDCIITKDSGDTGGFLEKCQAADQTGAKLMIIGRPSEETGYSFQALQELLCARFHIEKDEIPKNRRKMFPLFLSLQQKQVVVFGGGQVSERRVLKMAEYGAQITVISPTITPKLQQMADNGEIKYSKGAYKKDLLQNFDIAVAATNNRQVNRQIGTDAEQAKILCNIADKKEESSFYFPALIEGEKLVAGVISTDGDHKQVKTAAKKLRKVWREFEKDSESR